MMGMTVSTGSRNVKKYTIKNRNGSTAGTITVRKPQKPKKKKKLQYNFKQLSNQILQSKTSYNAKQVVTRTRSNVVSLRKKLYSDDYNYSDIRRALIHAEKMTRIAKKKVKHLLEEEGCKKGGLCLGDTEEERQKWEDACDADMLDISADKIKEIMEDLEEQLMELERELSDASSLNELAQELTPIVSREMDPEDFDLLKKKHRSEELREIMEADMKYLKALFNKLAREKQEGPEGSNNSYDYNSTGVSLELGGVDIPIEAMEVPVTAEGANLDVMA